MLVKNKMKSYSPLRAFIKGTDEYDTSIKEASSVEIIGNKRVVIEQVSGILAYETERVRISTKVYTIAVSGSKLTLNSYSDGIIVIDGKIKGVCLE